MAIEEKKKSQVPSGAASGEAPTVRWDASNMQSTYANVCNATSTREELALYFGINQAWHPGQKATTVQLQQRILMSPYAAKRLSVILGNVVREYENRFGELDVEQQQMPAPSKRSLS